MGSFRPYYILIYSYIIIIYSNYIIIYIELVESDLIPRHQGHLKREGMTGPQKHTKKRHRSPQFRYSPGCLGYYGMIDSIKKWNGTLPTYTPFSKLLYRAIGYSGFFGVHSFVGPVGAISWKLSLTSSKLSWYGTHSIPGLPT